MIHIKNKNIQAISLFWCWWFRLGFEKNQIEVKVSIDNDEDSIKTLEQNFEFKNKIIKEDIKSTKPKNIEKYLSSQKTIIIGGPPCQPFSKNGYWIKNENRKITKDPRNCIDDFIRFVEKINPDGFLIENVRKYFTSNK